MGDSTRNSPSVCWRWKADYSVLVALLPALLRVKHSVGDPGLPCGPARASVHVLHEYTLHQLQERLGHSPSCQLGAGSSACDACVPCTTCSTAFRRPLFLRTVVRRASLGCCVIYIMSSVQSSVQSKSDRVQSKVQFKRSRSPYFGWFMGFSGAFCHCCRHSAEKQQPESAISDQPCILCRAKALQKPRHVIQSTT
jgi:hypothetical protein